ncbi:MAG: TonB-dependent receptor [Myxococcota bacterium]
MKPVLLMVGAAVLSGSDPDDGNRRSEEQDAPLQREHRATDGSRETKPSSYDVIAVRAPDVRRVDVLITETEIALRQPDHLSDFLNDVPGLQVAGAHSTVARINIRGLDDRDLTVYQDGVLQMNDMWTHVGSILVTPEALASVDVDLGINDIAYAGLAGSVRFRTKSARDVLAPGERLAARVTGTYASNAAVAGSASLAAEILDVFDALAFVRYEDRRNYETGNNIERLGSDTNTVSGLLKLGFDFASGQRAELSYDTFRDTGESPFFPDLNPQTSLTLAEGNLIPTDYRRDVVALRLFNEIADTTTLDTTFGYTFAQLRRDERSLAGTFGRGTSQEGQIESLTLNARGRTELQPWPVDGAALSYGAEVLSQDSRYIVDVVANARSADQQLESQALFIGARLPATEWLTLRSGVRQNWYELTFGDGINPKFDGLTYSIGAKLTAIDGLSLFADTTTLFKGPELNRPFSGGGLTKLDNPDLVAETGRNSQVGAHFSGAIPFGTFDLSATGFITEIEDFILESSSSDIAPATVRDRNVGDLTIRGFEATARVSFGASIMELSYAKADYDADRLDFEPFVLTTSDAVYAWRETGDTIGVDVRHVFEDLGVELNWNSQFVLAKTVFNDVRRPAYDVHGLFARWRDPLGLAGFAFGLGADNLFDETYAPHAGRTGTIPFGDDVLEFNDLAPGRNIKLTIEAAI